MQIDLRDTHRPTVSRALTRHVPYQPWRPAQPCGSHAKNRCATFVGHGKTMRLDTEGLNLESTSGYTLRILACLQHEKFKGPTICTLAGGGCPKGTLIIPQSSLHIHRHSPFYTGGIGLAREISPLLPRLGRGGVRKHDRHLMPGLRSCDWI